MAGRQLEPLTIATDWLHGFAQTCLPSDASFEFSPDDLRRQEISLLDVRHLFRTGTVVWADKLEGPGGLWLVEGYDLEGRELSATIVVVSESIVVRLLDINLVGESNGNDAA